MKEQFLVDLQAKKEIKKRLESIRRALRAENISMGELLELQKLKDYIEAGDVELLEAAGVPEFGHDENMCTEWDNGGEKPPIKDGRCELCGAKINNKEK